MLHASEPALLYETADRTNTVRHALERFLALAAMEVIMNETVDTFLPFALDGADTDREGADRASTVVSGYACLSRIGSLDD
jgi:hypothetical protein